MTVMQGHKQTDAGVIPEDWHSTTVGEQFHVQIGKMLDATANSGISKPFIGNSAVQWGQFDLSRVGDIKLTTNDLRRYRLREGDLLVCEGGEVGRAAIWRHELDECYYQKALHRLRSKNFLDPRFMLNVLSRLALTGILANYVTQTSIAHLPKDKLETIPFGSPPTKAEQSAIAEALSDADALIESLEQLIAKKRQIKQGAMQQLLSGQKRLPAFREKLRETTLGEQAHIKTGSKNNENKVATGAYSFFVRSENVERIDTYSHDCEAILVPGEGRIGEIFHYVNGRFDVHQRVYAITGFQAKASGKFLYYYLSRYFGAWAMQNTVKATVDSLRLPTFLDFQMFLPPTEKEQTAIAEILSDMDTEISELETKFAKAQQVKQGMMQQLLTGQIRLV